MSIYCPNPKNLYPAKLDDGWWVMDQFGKLYGPYTTMSEAKFEIEDVANDYYGRNQDR